MMGDQREQVVDRQGPALREAHCVLWHAQNLPASSELCAALDRRGMIMHAHDQRATALAELCSLRGPRVNAEVPSPRALILVFVEPDRLLRPDEMKEVIERYAPKTAMWLYRSAGNPQLRAVNDQDVQRWRAQRPVPQPRVAASIKSPSVWAEAKTARKVTAPPVAPVIVGPRLRLAGEVRPGAPSAQPPSAAPVEPNPVAQEPGGAIEAKPPAAAAIGPMDLRGLLSEEELAMLLAGESRPSQV
ncbi:MAG: hypothetical protein IT436_10875 [Phycisphaerales bacterium]|nr:hypothetical protein [Phycisphaerales bacterium]